MMLHGVEGEKYEISNRKQIDVCDDFAEFI